MQQKPFIIYKSSAGSGKTFTLTLEYLKLALKYPGAYKQILAVTFTNKATQEMKERILEFLLRLSSEVSADEFLDQQLMMALGFDEAQLKKAARNTLLDILHGYGYFSVSTIDSFFQKVIRSFAREMDLDAKFEVELDQDAILERLVDRVVELVSEDKRLRKWLVNYASEQIESEKSWDVRRAIKGLGKEIFRESFKAYQELFRKTIGEGDFLEQFTKVVREQKAALISEANEVKAQANDIRMRFGLEWKDFKGGATRSFANRFEKLGDKDNPSPGLTEPMKRDLSEVDNWYAKTSPKKSEIEEAAAAGLMELAFKIPDLHTRGNTLNAIAKNLNDFGVFRNLISELQELKSEEGILLISDVNDFLKRITQDSEAPFIYEKIGNQYKHFLIDEFQDTSDFQWSSFKPLLENSLASGHTNLIVGDVKQSIYRWRGGRLDLLLSEVEKQIHKEYQYIRNLQTNWRSLPNIVSFNNSLFSKLGPFIESKVEAHYGLDPGGILQSAFAEVVQDVPEKKRALDFQGRIELEFIEKTKQGKGNMEEDEEEEDEPTVLDKLPGLVMQLQDKGYEPKDIAFLVRKNDQGANVADTLLTYAQENPDSGYRFDVLSEESLFLWKSAAVKCIIAALTYMNNPADLIPLKTMWFYYAQIFGLEYDHELFDKRSIPGALSAKQEGFLGSIDKWLQLPLMELLEELISFLGFFEKHSDLAYISGLKEAVYDFVSKNRADLQGFLDWWEINSHKRTVKIPHDHNAMRILTIHKSKGLQFKVVVMPYLDWQVVQSGQMASILWSEYQVSEHVQTVLPISHQSSLADSAFKNIYNEEIKLSFLDSMNMLYVAFTRAEEAIYGFSGFSKHSKGKLNPVQTGNLLYGFFKALSMEGLGEGAAWDDDRQKFSFGNWAALQIKKDTPGLGGTELRWNSVNWREKLKTREFAWDFSEKGLEGREQRQLGLLVHEILENAKNLTSAKLSLKELEFEGRIDEETKEKVETEITELFARPEFLDWYEGDYQVLAEQGILLPGGKQKRPDRILIGKNKALVVDFKTGEKRSSHQAQVREYMQLVGGLTNLPVKGFLCYVGPTEILEIDE
ncbi:UvrD-helicase domain-containing protein [Algoriphagus sediminis]|uniref:DNA 3'-5' helicase n=1 Tax=Algoriphagus sediminis TaxID=3057113 RepID=A0ABT7Y9U1_9BACT|nr:UvrD-helicase domain-containing protein [Algoriphagus sediminis]MDN3203273.1 UvrD-helicase domain-containing protein [Algoriphagus sediminis]